MKHVYNKIGELYFNCKAHKKKGWEPTIFGARSREWRRSRERSGSQISQKNESRNPKKKSRAPKWRVGSPKFGSRIMAPTSRHYSKIKGWEPVIFEARSRELVPKKWKWSCSQWAGPGSEAGTENSSKNGSQSQKLEAGSGVVSSELVGSIRQLLCGSGTWR